jgi:hypothetical protein
MNYSINKNFCNKDSAKNIINFCLEHGEPFSYGPGEVWDCRRIYDTEFKSKIINILNDKYTTNNFKLWFDYKSFDLKNFNISLTSYYDGRYLNLHKDKTSELTTVIVLSDEFDGGQFALSESKNPSINFKNLDDIELFSLKLGDYISFNGTKTFHGVLPVTNGIRYALNLWMSEIEYPTIKNTNSLL